MNTTDDTPDTDDLDDESPTPESDRETDCQEESPDPAGSGEGWLLLTCATVGLVGLTSLPSFVVIPDAVPVPWIAPACVGVLGVLSILVVRRSWRREQACVRQALESIGSLADPSEGDSTPSGLFAEVLEVTSRRIEERRIEEREELQKQFRRDLTRLRSECERLVEKHAETAIEEKRSIHQKFVGLQTEREEETQRRELQLRQREERERAAELVARDLRDRVSELEVALSTRGQENTRLVADLKRVIEEREKLRSQGVRYFDKIAAQLRGSVQIVRRLVDEILSESSSGPDKSVVAEIGDRLGRLEHVIQEVIEFCKLESASVSFVYSELDLSKTLQKWIGEHRDEAQERGVTLSLDLPESISSVLTDVRLTGKVIRELLSNAVRFTPRGGRITVAAKVEDDAEADGPAADGVLRIEVADTGPGIDDEDRERIFRPFERGGEPRYTLSDSNVGLGLTLARGYARLLGGSLDLDNGRGQGTVFSATLPIKVCTRVEY